MCARTDARAPTRASKAEEEGGKAINGAEKQQREATRPGQPAWTQTNRNSTARQRAHARAPTHRLGSGAPAGVERRSTSAANEAH